MENTQEAQFKELVAFIVGQMHEGRSDGEIRSMLTARGLESELASNIVASVRGRFRSAKKSRGNGNIAKGAFFLAVGIIVTAISYNSAGPGESYILAWGAIIGGGIQLVIGLFQNSGDE
jgi:hypothetical protein